MADRLPHEYAEGEHYCRHCLGHTSPSASECPARLRAALDEARRDLGELRHAAAAEAKAADEARAEAARMRGLLRRWMRRWLRPDEPGCDGLLLTDTRAALGGEDA